MRRNSFVAPVSMPLFAAVLLAGISACATGELHPCLKGGEPAREKPATGTRQCEQIHDRATGLYLNHGTYREWHPNGKLALEGEYKRGVRSGKWIEWDPTGKKLSERWFEDGKEVPSRSAKSDPPPGTAAAAPIGSR